LSARSDHGEQIVRRDAGEAASSPECGIGRRIEGVFDVDLARARATATGVGGARVLPSFPEYWRTVVADLVRPTA